MLARLSSVRFVAARSLSSTATAETQEAVITVTRVRPPPRKAASEESATPGRVGSRAKSSLPEAVEARLAAEFPVRTDWTEAEVRAVYDGPLLELVRDAASVHRAYWDSRDVQQCTLLSIKTGGCTEDCGYCSQSVRYKTHVKPTRQMVVDDVVEAAKRAKASGSTRFCMGAAWRELGSKKKAFREILEMVEQVSAMDMEVCATLGMLDSDQARLLKQAGLTAYNHNLDTSRDFYPKVVTTRTYDDRLATLQAVHDAGLSVCSGGILGLGEEDKDRVALLHTLATLPAGHPESVPVNALVAVGGTKMEDNATVDVFEMTRMIATARIVMPKTMVRLSAGRLEYSNGEQALMFLAGANSIFNGDKLLTTPNPQVSQDAALFAALGLRGTKPKPKQHKAE